MVSILNSFVTFHFAPLLQKTLGGYSLMSKEFCLIVLLALFPAQATFLVNEYKSCFPISLKFKTLALYKSVVHD